MQASQNLMALAAALADAIILYIPDRGDRGLRSPPPRATTTGCE
jgi:hypothetical protein